MRPHPLSPFLWIGRTGAGDLIAKCLICSPSHDRGTTSETADRHILLGTSAKQRLAHPRIGKSQRRSFLNEVLNVARHLQERDDKPANFGLVEERLRRLPERPKVLHEVRPLARQDTGIHRRIVRVVGMIALCLPELQGRRTIPILDRLPIATRLDLRTIAEEVVEAMDAGDHIGWRTYRSS